LSTKAQGLSLNVIIVAAIALIVLIVLWAVFTGRMGRTVSELDECRSCAAASDCQAEALEGHESCINEVSSTGGRIWYSSGRSVCCLLKNG